MVLVYETKEKDSEPKETKPTEVKEVSVAISASPEEKEALLTPQIQELIESYTRGLSDLKREFTPIHVDELASKVSKFYEKIRKVVDWKDDNALRRNAIERVLKRVFFPKVAGIDPGKTTAENIAKIITLDLIRGGHLPNDKIPKERIKLASNALKKYLVFLENANSYKKFDVKQKINYTTFILEISACELEEILTNPIKEYGIIKAMADTMYQRISISIKDEISPEYKKRQIFAGVCRALYDLDDNFIIYKLLSADFSNWSQMEDTEAHEVSKHLQENWKEMSEEINSPLTRKIVSLCRKIDTVFIILDDILETYKEKPKQIKGIFEDKEKFAETFNTHYDARHKTLKTRLFRLAVFSTLSVFLSNWFTFYIVEVPLAKLFYEGFNWLATVVDFVVPTVVMFLMVFFIKGPDEENGKRVFDASLGFIYNDEKKEKYDVSISTKKPSIFRIFLLAIYIETILFVFGLIAYVFYIARLPITSVIFDTLTIALTVFAAVGIKNKSLELNVDDRTSLKDFIVDTISVPIAKVGSILAKKWKEYNIIAIFFNFIIETPFSMILDFIQGWSEYIKERREEIL